MRRKKERKKEVRRRLTGADYKCDGHREEERERGKKKKVHKVNKQNWHKDAMLIASIARSKGGKRSMKKKCVKVPWYHFNHSYCIPQRQTV